MLPSASSLHFWSIKLSNSWIDLDLVGILLLRFGGKFAVLSGSRCGLSLFWLVAVLKLFQIDGINGLLLIKLISNGSNILYFIYYICMYFILYIIYYMILYIIYIIYVILYVIYYILLLIYYSI